LRQRRAAPLAASGAAAPAGASTLIGDWLDCGTLDAIGKIWWRARVREKGLFFMMKKKKKMKIFGVFFFFSFGCLWACGAVCPLLSRACAQRFSRRTSTTGKIRPTHLLRLEEKQKKNLFFRFFFFFSRTRQNRLHA
jgi:hypothetical protein